MKKTFFTILFVMLSCFMAAAWAEDSYTIYYSDSDDDHFSSMTTEVPLGTEYTTIRRIAELGDDFAETGRDFIGWKAYNPDSQKWYTQNNQSGSKSWQPTDESGNLPDGYSYYLYVNGAGVRQQTTAGGRICFYAQWDIGVYTIYYSASDEDVFSERTTNVPLGTDYTTTLSISELGFDTTGRVFRGWKAFRTMDAKWYATNGSNKQWVSSDENGELPEGYSYYLYANCAGVRKQSCSDDAVFFYAQWNTDGNEIVYYTEDNGIPLGETTHLSYDIPSTLRTVQSLGINTSGRIFLGWKAQRVSDGCYMVMQSNGTATWRESLSAGDSYYLYPDGGTVYGYYQSGEIHYYAQWRSTFMDVTESMFGANGEDLADDRSAIQKALNMVRKTSETITVHIPSGNYYIDASLIIYSNTNLVLDDDAIIICSGDTHIMLNNGSLSATPAGEYGRSENIRIQGGTWDGNGQSGEVNSSLIGLVHANNVTVSGVTMKNCCGNHFLDFAGVSNAQITDCEFRNFIRKNGVDYEDDTQTGTGVSVISEAVQLDYASSEGSGGAEPYDGTACRDITISGCNFINCQSGIGNHHLEATTYGYRFLNNSFSGMKSYCINLYSGGEALISGNVAEDVSGFAFLYHCEGKVDGNSSIVFRSNRIINSDEQASAARNGITILASEGVIVDDNEVSGFINGIQIASDSSDIILNGNDITHMQGDGIRVADSSCRLEANTVNNIADNGIRVANTVCDIYGNILTECGGFNIVSYESCSGTLEENTYDLSYGIGNFGNISRGTNHYMYADKEPDYFTVIYHESDDAEPAEQTTVVIYGEGGRTLTVKELEFRQKGKTFIGWKMYRNDLKSWGIMDQNDSLTWSQHVGPEDRFRLYSDGVFVKTTVGTGAELHLYAQWETVEASGRLILPGSLQIIEEEAFCEVNAVLEVFLNEGTRTIGAKAFAYMSGLRSITIPDSVVLIADDAFAGSDVTIRCSDNSYARNYAERLGIAWEERD